MDNLLQRSFNVYKIFLKNKVAMSLLMLFSGIMMFISALNGKGNDLKTLPIMITSIGAIFVFWSFYRLGYIKSNYDRVKEKADKDALRNGKKALFLQFIELAVCLFVVFLGIDLLLNEELTNRALDLMAGGFTILNGILGAISSYKNRDNKDFRWKLLLVMMVIEFIVGPYFIFGSGTISINGYIIMGVLTIFAGLIEVISAVTMEGIKSTIKDGKDIVKIIKD